MIELMIELIVKIVALGSGKPRKLYMILIPRTAAVNQPGESVSCPVTLVQWTGVIVNWTGGVNRSADGFLCGKSWQTIAN